MKTSDLPISAERLVARIRSARAKVEDPVGWWFRRFLLLTHWLNQPIGNKP